MPIARARLERLPRTQEMLPTSAGSGVIHPSGRQSEGWSPSGGIPINAPHPIVEKPPDRRADRHLNPPVRIQGGFLWPASRWIFRQRLSHEAPDRNFWHRPTGRDPLPAGLHRGCRQRSGCGFGAPVRGHLGHDQLRHLPHEALDFVHAPNHVANAFWVADPVVLKAFWCAGELDRPCHPIPPESSTISWPEEFDPHPKHLFMQPAWGGLAQGAAHQGRHPSRIRG